MYHVDNGHLSDIKDTYRTFIGHNKNKNKKKTELGLILTNQMTILLTES